MSCLLLHTSGYSSVFLGTAGDGQDAASLSCFKVYNKQYPLQPRIWLNIFRECCILSRLSDDRVDGVVQLLSVADTAKHFSLQFKPCLGGNLFQCLQRRECCEEQELCAKVIIPLLHVLKSLHARGIIHRDIKPENIFFEQDGKLVLGDFGLAIDSSRDKPVSRVGTQEYMAPEVLAQPSADTIALRNIPTASLTPFGTAVDIWALGVLIHEALTGKVPFYHPEPSVMALKAQFGRASRLPAGTSPECQAFVDAVLQQQAAKRPSAAELLEHPWIQQHAPAAAAVVAARLKAKVLAELQLDRPSDCKSAPLGATSFCCSSSSSVTAGDVGAATADRLVSHAAGTAAAGAPARCAGWHHAGQDAAAGAVQDAADSKASTSSTYCPSDGSAITSSCGHSSNNSSSCCSRGGAGHGSPATPAALAGRQQYQVQQQRTPDCPCQPRKVSFDCCATQQQHKATPVCVAALKAAAAAGSRATPPQQRQQPAQQRASSPGFALTAGRACAGSDAAQGAGLTAAAAELGRADSSDVPQTERLHLLPALSEPVMLEVSTGSSSSSHAGCASAATATAAGDHMPACCVACTDGCEQAGQTSYSAPTHTGPLQAALSAGHSRSLGTLAPPSRARRVVELGCSSSTNTVGQRKPPLLKANSTAAAAAQGPGAGNIPSPKSLLPVGASPPKPAMLLQRIRSLTQRERRRHSVDLTGVALAAAHAADAGAGSGSQPAAGSSSPAPPELSSPPRPVPRARPAAGGGLASPLAALSKLTGFLSPPSMPLSVSTAAAARSQSTTCPTAPCCKQEGMQQQRQAGSCGQAQRGAACAEGGTAAALMVGLAGTGCAGVAEDGCAWEGRGLISPSRGCRSAKGVCIKMLNHLRHQQHA